MCVCKIHRIKKLSINRPVSSNLIERYLARSAHLPNGLYILPSVSFFHIEQSWLRIYWIDFHDLFTKWKVFA